MIIKSSKNIIKILLLTAICTSNVFQRHLIISSNAKGISSGGNGGNMGGKEDGGKRDGMLLQVMGAGKKERKMTKKKI